MPDTPDQSPATPPVAPTQTSPTSDPNQPVTATSPETSNSAPTTNSPSYPTSPMASTQPTPVSGPGNGIVTNAQSGNTPNNTMLVTNQPDMNDPKIVHASRLRSVAQVLAGSPKQTVIKPDGTVTTQDAPVSTKNLWMAIALEAVGGALTGLSQSGPNANARGAAMAFQQGQQAQQQQRTAAEQQAQTDAKNKSDALVRSANLAEISSRTVLNVAESEARGADTLQKYADQNKDLIQAYDDAGQLIRRHMTQQELMSGLQDKTIDPFAQLGPVDGYVLTGDGRVEATHALIGPDPNVKVPLTQEMADTYAAAHLPGWPTSLKVPPGYEIQGTTLARANEQMQSLALAQQRHDEVVDALSKSDSPDVKALASQIPTINTLLADPKKGAGLFTALSKFQSYISHNQVNDNGHDLYTALQAMDAPSMPDPANKNKFIPNPNQPFAARIAMSYSPNGDDAAAGFKILKAYHDEITPEPIKNVADAESIIVNNPSNSKAYRIASKFLQVDTAQKAAVARAGRESTNGPNIPGNPNLVSSTPINGVNTGYLQSLPPAQQAVVKAIGEGRQEGPNTRTKEGQALSEMVNNAYPGYDGTRFPTYQAMQKDFVSGKSSQGLLALNTALSHLQTAFDNANLGSTLPGISNLERLGGNQSAVALKAASTAVSDELGRAYKAGVVSETERQQWQALLNGWTPANVKQNAIAFAHLLDGKLSSYEQTLRNGAPSAAVRLPALMSPQAAAAYTHMTGESPATSVGTNQTSGAPSQPASAQQFSKITSDGKMGWDGKQWVTIPNGGRQ